MQSIRQLSKGCSTIGERVHSTARTSDAGPSWKSEIGNFQSVRPGTYAPGGSLAGGSGYLICHSERRLWQCY